MLNQDKDIKNASGARQEWPDTCLTLPFIQISCLSSSLHHHHNH